MHQLIIMISDTLTPKLDIISYGVMKQNTWISTHTMERSQRVYEQMSHAIVRVLQDKTLHLFVWIT
jgi:hypothetical protein